MRVKTNLKIITTPDEFTEGLFGQIVLFIFEILPYLEQKKIFPGWNITSKLYGQGPDFTVIPGVFELAYRAAGGSESREIDIGEIRRKHLYVLGNDWKALSRLWHTYFKIPDRILTNAGTVPVTPQTLGLHYRGNDKNRIIIDSNEVSQQDFILLVEDFLKTHQEITSLYLATDEFSFVGLVKEHFSRLAIINLGEVGFHKDSEIPSGKADRALLDSLLLSRCGWVIKCSSALSGFSKILNPELEIYRVSANKLFIDIPYFPDAYIPHLQTSSEATRAVLEKLMKDDWTLHPHAAKFKATFRSRKRRLALNKIAKALCRLKRSLV